MTPTDLPIDRHDTLDSTSDLARRAAETAEAPRVFPAATQTAGRGRFGRAWSTPRGGLWVTRLWPGPGRDPAPILDCLGLRVGLAMLRAIEHEAATGRSAFIRCALKWPNDILIEGRKVAGALVEVIHAQSRTTILVGVGVNANFDTDALPADIRAGATTLRSALGADIDLDRLLADLLRRLQTALGAEGLDTRSLADLRARLHGVGRETRITMPDRSTRAGVLVGLDSRGCPILRDASGAVETLSPGVELSPAP